MQLCSVRRVVRVEHVFVPLHLQTLLGAPIPLPSAAVQRRWMAGHNKWSKIKHSKGANDAKRSIVLTKMSKEITAAAKEGGPDPLSNLRLSYALDRAKAQNVPKDLVETAIKRATAKSAANSETVLYEGNGVGGTAILVECQTDNRKRTAPAMRHIFTKFGGDLGSAGAAAYAFETIGVVEVVCGSEEESEDLLACVLDAGAEDVEDDFDDGVATVICGVGEGKAVAEAAREADFKVLKVENIRRAKHTLELTEDEEDRLARMLNEFESHEDVSNVFHNAE